MAVVYEHPHDVAQTHLKPIVYGYQCPNCKRTDQLVATRRVLEAADLKRVLYASAPDPPLWLAAKDTGENWLKCRFCYHFFERPLRDPTLIVAFLVSLFVIPLMLLVAGETLAMGGHADWVDSIALTLAAWLSHNPIPTSFGLLGIAFVFAAWLFGYNCWVHHLKRQNWQLKFRLDQLEGRADDPAPSHHPPAAPPIESPSSDTGPMLPRRAG